MSRNDGFEIFRDAAGQNVIISVVAELERSLAVERVRADMRRVRLKGVAWAAASRSGRERILRSAVSQTLGWIRTNTLGPTVLAAIP